MNIKLHTPKTLKAGSGMSNMRQFLLSLLATTVSIVLTFGTAAIIDGNKKRREKREIVMMVMYDMYTSLQSVEKADSMLRRSIDFQCQLANDTTLFEQHRFDLVHLIPTLEYTETVEHIFSTSIESINTVGNVLFAENVASFFQARKLYKTEVCDSMFQMIMAGKPFQTARGSIEFNYFDATILSGDILSSMRRAFRECQQMMDVTDEQLEAYSREREELGFSEEENAERDSLRQDVMLREKKKVEAEKSLLQ